MASSRELTAARQRQAWERTAEEQTELLQSLLEKNSACEYLQRHGLNGSTDMESFKKHIPVIEYDAIEQDIQRILQGEHASGILSSEVVEEFFVSSGTASGKRKVFPVTQHIYRARELNMKLMDAYLTLDFGDAATSGLTLYFANATKPSKSPGGLDIGTVTSAFFRMAFNSPHSGAFFASSASPMEVFMCDDYHQAIYCHLLCGLVRYPEVHRITGVLASGVVNALYLLKAWWKEISTDIETGHLSSRITDPSLRAAVSQLLAEPNPELANRIRGECGKEPWEGVILRLWPNLKFITGLATGSLLQYVPHLKFLSSATLLIVSVAYGGSEGYYAMNPNPLSPPDETFYVFKPQLCYFEFLVLNGEEQGLEQGLANLEISHGKPAGIVDLASVKEGEEYELVLTNGSGLWRYRVGDIVKCVGFFHNAPKFKIVGRRNVIGSVSTEKIEEQELVRAISTVARLHFPPNTQLADFTSCISLSSIPGHHVIFLEVVGLSSVHVGEGVLQESCLTVEAALGEPYRRGRNLHTIAPLELKVVKPGTFEKLRDFAAETLGTAVTQYKTPRAFKIGHPALEILNAGVTESGRSPRPPPHPKLNPDGLVQSDV